MKRPPSVCWECVPCRETYFGKTQGRCEFCRQPLTVRPPGGEPYGGPEAVADEDVLEASAVVGQLQLFAASRAPVGGGG